MARWLTNPKDSAMFQAVMSGSPIKMKSGPVKNWLRDQLSRAMADASKGENPDFYPVPTTATRQDFKDRKAGAYVAPRAAAQ